jgi:hypothetical protein
MGTLSTLSTLTADADAVLARLELELAEHYPDLMPPIARRWHEYGVITFDGDSPWWIGPAERDPQRDHRGRLAVPRKARARLRELAASRVPFRRIAIAHELDPSGPVRDLLPELAHGAFACPDGTARTLVGPPPAHPALRRAPGLLDRAVHRASGVVDRIADAALDPIVFGVVAPRSPEPGDATLWVPLVAWRW